MSKKPKKSHSKMSLEKREKIARRLLREKGYSKEQIARIIDKAFYTDE